MLYISNELTWCLASSISIALGSPLVFFCPLSSSSVWVSQAKSSSRACWNCPNANKAPSSLCCNADETSVVGKDTETDGKPSMRSINDTRMQQVSTSPVYWWPSRPGCPKAFLVRSSAPEWQRGLLPPELFSVAVLPGDSASPSQSEAGIPHLWTPVEIQTLGKIRWSMFQHLFIV